MENFITDLLNQLLEDAFEFQKKADDDFGKGNLFGYYISIVRSKISSL